MMEVPMNDEELLKRITFNPRIFGGKPIVRGMRIVVEHILGMLAAGLLCRNFWKVIHFLKKRIFRAVCYTHIGW